jgi:hypothetical protein
MRKALIAVVLVALAVAGAASALAITRHVTLKAGECMTVKATRVCAAKSKTRTIVDRYTVTSPGQTVTTPGRTVTTPGQTVTMTVTTPAATPPPPTAPVTLDFSGNGSGNIAPFALPVGETFAYTVTADTFGQYGNFITDCGYVNGWIGTNALGVPSGSTYIPAGTYSSCSIIAEDSWTIHIS